LIAIDLVKDWLDKAYYASLPASFTPIDDSASLETSRVFAVDFEAVQKEAPDAEAWIRIDGTVIDYPVMYGKDNEYYLTRLPNGKKSKSGSIFIDYRNAPDFSDANTLIHGHHMRSGAMFGTLKNYAKQSFYDNHRTAYISTPEKNFEVMLFAGYKLDHTVEIPPLTFKDAKDFDKYIRDVKRRSIFKSDVEVTAGDRLVCLATCDYSFDNSRLVIVGKLIEK